MKTALYSTCYLEGRDKFGNNRLERTIRYVDWYANLKELIGYNRMFFCDNGSSIEKKAEFRNWCPETKLWEYDNLPESPIPHGWPYCWRGLWTMNRLINMGYEKIIFMDTDAFIVSERLANYIKQLNTGWEAFWVPRDMFPSAECHVLCKDAFPVFLEYTKEHWAPKVGLTMERELPFTKVNKDFNTDRYGEDEKPQTSEMDGYFQAQLDIPLTFNMIKNF